MWAIRSSRSWQKSDMSDLLFHKQIALLLTKNERIARKTDEQIQNPANYGTN